MLALMERSGSNPLYARSGLMKKDALCGFAPDLPKNGSVHSWKSGGI